jgi:acetyl-CoA carboxylase beta subunit
MLPRRQKCIDCDVILFDDEIQANDGLCYQCKAWREAMQVEHVMNSSDAASGPE